jgi:hypothetical protein
LKVQDVIDQQLAAYNARDLQRFVATYHCDVEIFRPPATDPILRGRDALAAFYGRNRFCHAGLRVEIFNRVVIGNIVADHERVHGLPNSPMDAIVTYDVQGDVIRRVWLFSPAVS